MATRREKGEIIGRITEDLDVSVATVRPLGDGIGETPLARSPIWSAAWPVYPPLVLPRRLVGSSVG